MEDKAQIINLSWQVDDLLSQYVAIHNDVFKSSIRHYIPIPGIFKEIDFGIYLKKVENIIPALENCDNKIKSFSKNVSEQEREYLDLFSKYVGSLIETVSYLKVVVGAFYAQSQSLANSKYSWGNSRRDHAKYKQSVQNYRALGGRLNKLFEKVK